MTSSPASNASSRSPTLTDDHDLAPSALLKPRLGMRRIKRHAPPSKIGGAVQPAKLALALVAATAGLAVARAGAAADALALLVLVNAAIDVVQIHDKRHSSQPLDFVPGAQLLAAPPIVALTRFDGIVRAEALGEDVVDAGRFAHGPHGAAGDHARTGTGRHQHHLGGAEAAFDRVRNRAAVERRLRSCCASRP